MNKEKTYYEIDWEDVERRFPDEWTKEDHYLWARFHTYYPVICLMCGTDYLTKIRGCGDYYGPKCPKCESESWGTKQPKTCNISNPQFEAEVVSVEELSEKYMFQKDYSHVPEFRVVPKE